MNPLPVAELRELGEKLQQSIVLTRMRVENMPASRAKAKAVRSLEHANKLFVHVSQVVQAATGLTGFLVKALGVSVEDMFAYTGKPKLARGVAYAGVAAANDAVKQAIDELAAANAALDKEVKNG